MVTGAGAELWAHIGIAWWIVKLEQAQAHTVMQGGHAKAVDPVGAVIGPVVSDCISYVHHYIRGLIPTIFRTMDSISNKIHRDTYLIWICSMNSCFTSYHNSCVHRPVRRG